MNIETINDRYPFKRYIAATTAAAIIGGAASLGSSIYNSWKTMKNQADTNQFNAQEAEKQRDWNKQMWNETNAWNYEMWQKENAYNTPAEQIKRLRDAGLNPMYYGLDGNSATGGPEAGQPLGYDRAVAETVNPNLGDAGSKAAMTAAQISSIELDNELKKKQIGWYDKEHEQEFDFKAASIDEVRKRIEEADSRIRNNEMDTKLKAKDVDKKDAEIALEWAKYAGQALDNELKEKLNPLVVRAQELENQLAETRNQYEAERILAELAETKAHIASLYAQAALDGARKEGVKLDNKIKEAEVKFAPSNARNKANLLKWTANEQGYKTSILKNTWKGKVSIDNYYAEHYEEAFRNSWSKSGVEYGINENAGKAIGSAIALGMMLAF